MPAVERRVEVLEQSRAAVGARQVAGQLDEVEVVRDRERARQVGDEDDARLERCDEQRLEPVVVGCDLPAELRDPCGYLLPGEVDLADRVRVLYEASFSR